MSANLIIDATFENGVFVPVQPLQSLSEHQRVTLDVVFAREDTDYRLPDGPFLDEAMPAPIDLPYFGESRVVECIPATERDLDAATLAELREASALCSGR